MLNYKYNKLLKFAFIALPILFFFYLFLKTKLYPTDYTFTEWFINYKGGFVKRGLGGQIALEFSNLTKLNIKLSILFIQTSGYLTFFYFFYKSIRRINLNFFWYLVIFSPLLIMYPLLELEALGRKDIFVISFFLIFTYINEQNKVSIIRNFFTIFLISSLIHEITIFYIFHYLFVFFLKVRNLNERITIQNIFWIFLFVFSIIFLNMHVSRFSNLDEMISAYTVHGLITNIDISTESGSISWLRSSFRDVLLGTASKIKINIIARYILVYFLFLFPFSFFLRTNKNIGKFISIKLLILLSLLIAIPMHLLIYDWGRVAYFSCNFFTITIIAMFNNKLINEDFINTQIKSLKKKIKTFFFIACCFSLAPKLTITEDLSTIPYIKISLKTIKEIVKMTRFEKELKELNNKLRINVN